MGGAAAGRRGLYGLRSIVGHTSAYRPPTAASRCSPAACRAARGRGGLCRAASDAGRGGRRCGSDERRGDAVAALLSSPAAQPGDRGAAVTHRLDLQIA
jgi:hypothetical protein